VHDFTRFFAGMPWYQCAAIRVFTIIGHDHSAAAVANHTFR